MSYLTVRLPENHIKRLKQIAARRRVSMSTLLEEMTDLLEKEEASAALPSPEPLECESQLMHQLDAAT